MNLKDKSDCELVAAYANELHEDAFAELVLRHRAMVLGVCRRVTGSIHDAEDLTQVVFALFADRASSLTTHTSPAGWLSRTAWHLAARFRREGQRRLQREQAVALITSTRQPWIASDDDLPEELSVALKDLTEPQREMIVLYHLSGLTLPQISQMTGEPVGTLAGRLSRARGILRHRLSERGLDLTAVGLPEFLLFASLRRPYRGDPIADHALPELGQTASRGAPIVLTATQRGAIPVPIFASTPTALGAAPVAATALGAYLAPLCSIPAIAFVTILSVGSLTAGSVKYFSTPPKQASVPAVGSGNGNEAVRFREQEPAGYSGGGNTVPEPGTAATAGGTVVLLGLRRRRH